MTDFTDLVDLAAEALGGSVVAANDEFFAPKEGLLKPTPAEWREGVYTERGKWMDGWETRRRRTPGYDWAIIRLGAVGTVRGVVIDTSFFTGNYPERASIEGCVLTGPRSLAELEAAQWETLLPEVQLAGNTQNRFAVQGDRAIGHLRLNIFPDGGVARLRVHGDVAPRLPEGDESPIDVAAVENGGFAVVCSDMHYGHRQNLIMPGRSTHMGNGWETKRRRGPGNDWTIIRLGTPAEVHRVELDTDHYKGNSPDSCLVEGCLVRDASATQLADAKLPWSTVVPQSKLQPHSRHVFEVANPAVMSHVRLSIYPDGGVARLRVFGRPVQVHEDPAVSIGHVNRGSESHVAQLLAACCGSSKWVASMVARRPFEDLEDLLMASDEAAQELTPEDWLEAFRHHPRIGERHAQVAVSGAAARWSDGEQAAASESTRDVQGELAKGNHEYERRFGFIFIIRAAGRTPEQILGALRERLGNSPDAELVIAAREQQQITNLRLVKLFQAIEP